MPVYSFECRSCGHTDKIYRTISECDNELPACCNEQMSRVWGVPYVVSDMMDYKSSINGKMITSRSQHRQHLKDNGCFEVGNEINALMKLRPPAPDLACRDDIKRAMREVTGKSYD